MPNTTNRNYPYPAQGKKPYYSQIVDFFNAVDTDVQSVDDKTATSTFSEIWDATKTASNVPALTVGTSIPLYFDLSNGGPPMQIRSSTGVGIMGCQDVGGTSQFYVNATAATSPITLQTDSGDIYITSGADIKFTDSTSASKTLQDLLNNNLWTDVENLDIDTGTETVDSFSVTSDGMAVWELFVGSGGNIRQHTFKAAWDYSTNDISSQSDDYTTNIGDTSDLTLALSMSGGTITLEATAATDNWVVKGKRMSVTL